MPRQSRIDIPGQLQHVIVRGIERRNIFRNNTDWRDFVVRFLRILEDTGTDCFAWSLIPNHFHLLLRPNSVSLQPFMRRMLTGYAINFNNRHKRSGHLFQNRYKSFVCEQENYLLELVRYIHLNPVRAGLVKDLMALERFAWCGHGGLLGKNCLPGQAVDDVLGLFGTSQKKSRAAYLQFMADGLGQGQRPELVGGGLIRSCLSKGTDEIQAADERVLGSGAFVDQLRQQNELRASLLSGLSLAELLARVAGYFEMSAQQLTVRSRDPRRCLARDVFCALAIRGLRYSGVEVGKVLGIGRAAVSHAVRRGETWVDKEPGLEEDVLI